MLSIINEDNTDDYKRMHSLSPTRNFNKDAPDTRRPRTRELGNGHHKLGIEAEQTPCFCERPRLAVAQGSFDLNRDEHVQAA